MKGQPPWHLHSMPVGSRAPYQNPGLAHLTAEGGTTELGPQRRLSWRTRPLSSIVAASTVGSNEMTEQRTPSRVGRRLGSHELLFPLWTGGPASVRGQPHHQPRTTARLRRSQAGLVMIGQRIASYEITARLGEGGMGEVYRARDTKLGREVALKILPPAVAEDRNRLARFQREARVLAALSHPHIATIHGIEDDTDIHALVMELVEGQTSQRSGSDSPHASKRCTVVLGVSWADRPRHPQEGTDGRDDPAPRLHSRVSQAP